MKFADLRLAEPLVRAVTAEGYDVATPIQSKAIPFVMEGRDVLGCAQTGTGKTAAFALPILHRLSQSQAQVRGARVLVLCPTRELALQIQESFQTYGRNLPFKSTVVFGGVNQRHQVDALRRGVEIVIATPGRLLDLMQQRCCDLRNVETLVLDEADRMLDMGFINDIRKIVAQVPAKRQTLLFSATMPREIRSLADALLKNAANVQVTPPATTLETIEQSVYFVDKGNKPALLAHLFDALPMSRAIVFTRTKHGADRVVRHLHKAGIRAEAIHGNKSQNARERALSNFRESKTPILVATDIASRGIDVDGISHVVNYDLTHEPETYVHRIGRTARAGASGSAISFCDRDERSNLRAIEAMIRKTIPVCNDHPKYATSEHQPAPQHGDRAQVPSRHPRPSHPRHESHPRSESRQPHAARQPHAGRPQRAAVNHPVGGGVTHRKGPSPREANGNTATATAPRPQRERHPLHGGINRGPARRKRRF